MAYNQLLNGVQVDHLAVTNGTSAGVDMTGYRSVAFLVNLSSANGTGTVALEESPDNGNWTAVAPSYYVNTTSPYPTADATSVTANGTVSAANKFLVIEFNRLGRETSVPDVTADPTSDKYLRVNVTSGTVGYCLALKSNAMWEPVTQPDVTARTVASN
jgi:hypothetical protein